MIFKTIAPFLLCVLSRAALVSILSFDVALAAGLSGSSVRQKQRVRQKQPEAYQESLFQWVSEDPDGFVHPSILFQRLGPEGKSGPYAMHVTEDIPAGTPLIVLPRKYVIESYMKKTTGYEDDYRMCVTVKIMLDEYQKHKNTETSFLSFYAPYLEYLFEDNVGGTTRGLLPSTWSFDAREVLYDVLEWTEAKSGNLLQPYEFEYDSIFDICKKGNPDNKDGNDDTKESTEDDHEDYIYVDEQMAEGAYLFLVSRGWYDKLLPVVDMLNHRNGPGRNVEVTPIDDEEWSDVAAYAWRDIRKGEQLQITYSECMDETCDFGWGRYSISTQFIFQEYGFVELYPRRWIFDIYNKIEGEEKYDHKKLCCEVSTDPNDDTKLVFQWIFETPTKSAVEWMEKQLARLKSIESYVKEKLGSLEDVVGNATIHNLEYERETILEFYEAYIEAFELALEHKDDPVGMTERSFEEEVKKAMQSIGMDTKTISQIRKHELLSSRNAIDHQHDNGEKSDDEL